MSEHPAYTRYNACVGGGALPADGGMYVNNHVMGAHGGDMGYGGALGAAGPSPGCAEPPPPAPGAHALAHAPRRRRTTNPQAEEKFQQALNAVRFGGIGFCKAARLFGVNNRTLWLEYKKKGYPNNRPSIRSRIKREHATPPPLEHKEEHPPPEQQQQMSLLCPPHAMPVGFIEPRPLEFPLQPHNAALNPALNLLGVNFNNPATQ